MQVNEEVLVREGFAKLTPKKIVEELDKYIVGQNDAKRAVAVALRNRLRRRLLTEEMREEVYPKNILMIGPTGCGKTEIARRLSKLVGAPFLKVEATKYTEVGYVGRDVESMIRDLVSMAISMVRKEFREGLESEAEKNTEERLLDLLLPSSKSDNSRSQPGNLLANLQHITSQIGKDAAAGLEASNQESKASSEENDRANRARELLRNKLKSGELEDREVEIEVSAPTSPMVQVLSGSNMEEIDMHVQNMLGDILPKKQKRKRLNVKDARRFLFEEEMDKMIDQDRVVGEAIRRTEELGIVFIDEMDKVCGRGSSQGADVSREGVQRDLLPIVEGATVNTRHGPVKTDHILFIAAGAFHQSKPSDMIPELQGRFPIRVELEKLTMDDFKRILLGPKNSLTDQAKALLDTEGVSLDFSTDGIDEIAKIAFRVNEETESIGARRLHTIMEKLLEQISFDAPDLSGSEKNIQIDRNFVSGRLKNIVEDKDLSRYIL